MQLLQDIANDIKRFDKECAADEHTDTGQVWDLFNSIKDRCEQQIIEKTRSARLIIEYDDESLQDMTDANDLTESELDEICRHFNNLDCSFIYEAIQDMVNEVVQRRENKP